MERVEIPIYEGVDELDAAGAVVAGACTGAMLLAASGMLLGLRAAGSACFGQNATEMSRQSSGSGRSASSSSTPATISANRLWSRVQIRMQPAWLRSPSAHSRRIGAKSRLLRVTRIRFSLAAGDITSGSSRPSSS